MATKFELFWVWSSIEKVAFDKENSAYIRAVERFAKIYDVIVKDNKDSIRRELNVILIRILF